MNAKQVLLKLLRTINFLVWFPFLCMDPRRKKKR